MELVKTCSRCSTYGRVTSTDPNATGCQVGGVLCPNCKGSGKEVTGEGMMHLQFMRDWLWPLLKEDIKKEIHAGVAKFLAKTKEIRAEDLADEVAKILDKKVAA